MDSFEKQYYNWAKSQVAVELARDFPLLRGLNCRIANRFLGILQTLPSCQVEPTWKALLKRFHISGAVAAGEGITEADRAAIEQYDNLCSLSFAVEPDSKTSTLIDKNAFQTAVKGSLEQLLGVRSERCGGKLIRLTTSTRNYVVETYLDAGSRNYQLCYWQNVIKKGLLLKERCSVLQWFGVGSQSYWDEVSEESSAGVVKAIGGAVDAFLVFLDALGNDPNSANQ